MAQRLILAHKRSPGDITCMTACVRDLATSYPGEFEIYIDSTAIEIWDNNPHIAGTLKEKRYGFQYLELDYGWGISQAGTSPLHFLTIFHKDLSRRLQLPVPVLKPRGDIHIHPDKKATTPISGRYWCMFAGGKQDYPIKIWSAAYAQRTVDMLADRGIPVVQCGATGDNFINPKLNGVLDLVGKTDLAELLWILYHADGVICPITAGMHIAAALEKPCVVTAGGREHWWWEAYVNTKIDNFGPIASRKVRVPHWYLHTQDMLDCCSKRGCWKNKVEIKNRPENNVSCLYVEDHFGQRLPQCHRMVTPGHVVAAVEWYYEMGFLPPIDQPFTGLDYENSLDSLQLERIAA